mmetsp:Transcript_34978/g.81131  ORF Transcript_34978/g.81131 Transcript_34978/m.81131 type:complete len:181 (+) Transcript_34978:93-635(+)
MTWLLLPAVLLLARSTEAALRALHRATAEPGLASDEVSTHAEVPFRSDGALEVVKANGEKLAVDLEVPDSIDSFMQGLMYRTNMCDRCSMIFSWDEDGSRPFWMKDTWIPLDLVWVNHEHVIVDIKQATANDLHSIANDSPAQHVFEFREHWCQDHGVRVGDTVSWQISPDHHSFVASDR